MLGTAAITGAAWTWGHLWAWNRSLEHALQGIGPRRRRPQQPQRQRINTEIDRPTGPTSPAPAPSAPRRPAMGTPIFVTAAEELAAAFSRYEPPEDAGGMYEMFQDVSCLPEALRQIALGIRTFQNRCAHEWPLHPAIADVVGELAKVQQVMADTSEMIPQAIRRLHPEDMHRHEEPRPGERRWNVA